MRCGLALALVAFLASGCTPFGESTTASSADAGSTEASTAGPDGAAPGARPGTCPAGAVLCEDFEAGLGRWSDVSSQTAVKTTTDHGNVLVAALPAGGNSMATIETDLAGATPQLRWSFSVRVADPGFSTEGGDANFAVAALAVAGSSSPPFIGMYLSRGEGGARVQITGLNVPDFRATEHVLMSYAQWHRVAIETALAPEGTMGFSLDGQSGSAIPIEAQPGAPRILLGLMRQNDATPALLVEIDDVVVENVP